MPPTPSRAATSAWPRTRWLAAAAALAFVAAGITLAWWLRGGTGPADGPIIFVSIDTLRADHLPAYGYTQVRTPAIDALAGDGVLFERAYAHSPQTLPSHASILSGRLPFETGVRDNVGFTIRPDLPMLPELLRARGYATGGFVSSFVLRKETGIDRGFDVFDSHMPEAAPDKPIGQIERRGEQTLESAERWMERLSSPKFFLFFHIYEPHKPYAPPGRFSSFAPYDGEIAWADEIVGQLIAWLKTRNLYDAATIVFFSDHGEGLGDHGEEEHGLFLYDETIRVPLVIKLPRASRAGQRLKTPVQHIDLVPTVLDWVGAPRPAGLRGRSLRTLIEQGTGEPGESGFYAEALYGRYHYGWSDLYALTDSRFRFIKAPRAELYDLERDPGEKQNVATQRVQTALAMRAALDRLLSGAPIDKPGAVSKDDLARLQALGYVGTQVEVAPVAGETLPDPKDQIGVLESHKRAVALASRREYDQSIALLKTILADNPKMKDLWLQLGVLQVRAGRLPDALGTFKRLVDVDSRDGKSLESVAAVLYQMGRLDDAAAHARTALSLLAGSDGASRTPAHEVLVKVALAKGDLAAARQEAALAQQADPTLPLPAYVEALILYNQGRYAEALPLFQDVIRRLDAHTITIQDLYYYTGDTLGRLGEARAAAEAFTMETRLSPENIRAHGGLAMLYRADGQAAQADAAIAQMLRAVPTSDGYAMAIRLLSIFGERGRATALRRDAVARFGEPATSEAERRVLARVKSGRKPGA
jgi:tetratricopeptide (TPR) repeat protein